MRGQETDRLRRAGRRADPARRRVPPRPRTGCGSVPRPAARRHRPDVRRPPDRHVRRGARPGRATACWSRTWRPPARPCPTSWTAGRRCSAPPRPERHAEPARRPHRPSSAELGGRRPDAPLQAAGWTRTTSGSGPAAAPARAPGPAPRTRTPTPGFVIAVDRGRYTVLVGDSQAHRGAGARARPRLGRRRRPGRAGRRRHRRPGHAGPDRPGRAAADRAAAQRRRRRPARAGHRRQRRPARRGHRAGRPAAADRADRPLPGRRVRRRARPAALPDQGRPGAAPAELLAEYADLGTPAVATRRGGDARARCGTGCGTGPACSSGTPGSASRPWSTRWSRTPRRATGAVSAVGRGRHTSSSAVALPLPGGGWVIDTPGIRLVRAGPRHRRPTCSPRSRTWPRAPRTARATARTCPPPTAAGWTSYVAAGHSTARPAGLLPPAARSAKATDAGRYRSTRSASGGQPRAGSPRGGHHCQPRRRSTRRPRPRRASAADHASAGRGTAAGVRPRIAGPRPGSSR